MNRNTQHIRIDRLMADLETLSRFGKREESAGIDRPAFSPAYRQAADWLMEMMNDIGLDVRMDAAGNVIGRLGSPGGAAVVCGSHIDSVPAAGKYDGTLGVLAGLEVARRLIDEDAASTRAFELIAFIDEEGAYLGEFGARAMIGDLEEAELGSCVSRDGMTLGDAIERFGLNPSRLADAARPREAFDAYVELHIEQGPVLDSEGVDIGIVESIVGLQVDELSFQGQANHAGTTPLSYRRDAFRAAAETVTRAFDTLEKEFASDSRLTYGAAEIAPGAANVVPGSVRLIQEIRAVDEHTIDAVQGMTYGLARAISEKRGVSVRSRLVSRDPSARMSKRLTGLIADVCGFLGLSAKRMPSGAGHDAQIMAQVCDTGMIFVPSKRGVSHNPAEYTSPSQIAAGASVLYETVRRLLAEP